MCNQVIESVNYYERHLGRCKVRNIDVQCKDCGEWFKNSQNVTNHLFQARKKSPSAKTIPIASRY